MIHHLSIAVREPARVASALAELIGGASVAFPPNPGSYWALQRDPHGTGIEIYPAGTTLEPDGDRGVAFASDPQQRSGYVGHHFAISVPTPRDEVTAIAAREGWQYYECMRGGFHVIEVWVENEILIEVLPPEFAAEYLEVTRPERVVEHMASVRRPPAQASKED